MVALLMTNEIVFRTEVSAANIAEIERHLDVHGSVFY